MAGLLELWEKYMRVSLFQLDVGQIGKKYSQSLYSWNSKADIALVLVIQNL
jgi:hypothetical protein